MKRLVQIVKRLLFRFVVIVIFISFFSVLLLRWLNPPLTSFMFARQIEAWQLKQTDFRFNKQWRDWDQISPNLLLAVIASEDQNFPSHFGIDFAAIKRLLSSRSKNGRLRGASTISQQLVKNLYLWSGRSLWRKGIEAYFTMLLEMLITKKRILELYVNVAEFGNGIYGVEAASKIHFNTSSKNLSINQASLLAATLPNPRKLSASHPSAYLRKRSRWIQGQMNQLGGHKFLISIESL